MDKNNNNGKARKKIFKVSKPALNIEISHKWTVTVVVLAFFLSVAISSVTSGVMARLDIVCAFFVLMAIVVINVGFDMIGTAVGAAEEHPFHSLAARRVSGAAQTISVIRHAPQVANLCNDVIGDIAGIISGASTALIVTKLATLLGVGSVWISLSLTGLVSSLTIGGKAFFKGIAMQNCNQIVFFIGKLLYCVSCVTAPFKKRKKGSKRK